MNDEIVDHQKNVDDVVSSGHELMKNSSGELFFYITTACSEIISSLVKLTFFCAS